MTASSNINQPLSPKAGRDNGVDCARGFLIVCIIVGHTPLGYLTGGNPTLFGLPVYYFMVQVIWFFVLPLFIAISCFYLQPLSFAYAAKRALVLLLPYVVYQGIQQWGALTGNPSWWLQMLAWGNFTKLMSIIWFLPALYACNLAAAAIVRYEHHPAFWVALTGLALLSLATGPWVASVHSLVPFGLDLAVMMLPFIFGLRLLERKRSFFAGIPRRAYLLFFLGAAGCLFVLEPPKLTNPWQNKIDLAQYSIPSTPINYVLWFAEAAAVFCFFRFKPVQFLSLLGTYSMPIYLLHYEVIRRALADKWPEKFGAGYAQALCVIAVALFLPMAIGVAARRLSRFSRYVGL